MSEVMLEDSLEQQLRQILSPEQILKQEPMAKHTTFRVGGPADYYLMPELEQVQHLMVWCREHDLPVTIIGNGSNLLVGDRGIRGLVMEFGKNLSRIQIEEDRLTAGAGTLLSQAAGAAAREGLGGMEFAAGIPGTVGGAVIMNAGAYGGEIKDILSWVRVLDRNGNIQQIETSCLDLSYRHSSLMENGGIVLEAQFLLKKKNQQEIYGLMEELKGKRLDKQPLEYPSAGSTFKRPEGYFAGKLIMDAGLRGYQVGDAQVSEKHCGFVINRGHATAADICQLMKYVSEQVEKQFGVRLEPEVRMIGEF